MPPHPAVTGIDHISLLAQDAERTTQFYVEVLGLHAIDHAPGDDRSVPGRIWLGDEGPGPHKVGRSRFITIAQATDGQPGVPGIGTIHHVGLAVASFDGLLKWKRWLQDNQLLVLGPYDQQAYQDLIVSDPDGVLVEIATYGPGFERTQDGENVYSPPKASMAPYRDEEAISNRTWPQPVTRIDPDMTLQGLHHVSTIVSSLERNDAFYREVLGLPLVRKTIDSDDPEVERWYWGLDGGRPGALVTAFPIVHPHEGSRAVYGRVGPGVALHYALDLGSPEALQSWITALSTAGIEVTSVLDEAGSQAASLPDPDGAIVELVTDPAAGSVDDAQGTPEENRQ